MLAVADPYETNVLSRDVHDRLVQNLNGYAEDAGIQKHWVWTPLADHVSAVELGYVRNYPQIRSDGMVKGLVMTRKTAEADPYERMSAITGAFVRNFIRARMMTVQRVLGLLKDGDVPVATVLLIPNFFHSKDEGGSILQWQASHLYDLLLQRACEGKQTVLYATDISEMGISYGSAFSRFVSNHYTKAEI